MLDPKLRLAMASLLRLSTETDHCTQGRTGGLFAASEFAAALLET